MPLEPVPETGRALAGLAGFADRPLAAELVSSAELVEEVVGATARRRPRLSVRASLAHDRR